MIEFPRPTACAAASGDGWHRGVLRSPAGGPGGGNVPPGLVVKIGGSLLSRPRWPALLATLLAGVGPRPWRIVVGGGAVVDGLRAIDRAAPQPAALVHSLAIDAMRLTGRMVATAIGLPMTSGFEASGARAVLDVPAWVARSAGAARLPAGWQVTSDTIAACVAAEHGAGLLLVKSVPPPSRPVTGDALAAVAAAGWVDDYFPVAAARLAEIGWAAPVTA